MYVHLVSYNKRANIHAYGQLPTICINTLSECTTYAIYPYTYRIRATCLYPYTIKNIYTLYIYHRNLREYKFSLKIVIYYVQNYKILNVRKVHI